MSLSETEEEKTQRGGEGCVKIEAETGVLKTQAQECLQPPEAGKENEAFSPRVFRGGTALPTPGFHTSGLQTVKINSCYFKQAILC